MNCDYGHMSSCVKISNVSKYYRSAVRGVGIQALSGLSLEIPRGGVFGLLGPNGAGKSTTIKIILGLLKPNSGECLVFGERMGRRARARIGYLPESPNFYRFLTGLELVSFYARLCGMSARDAAAASAAVLERVGLADAANRRLAEYSKGMLQRAGLAQALVHGPELVILDEPSSGLDPIGMEDMARMILDLKNEGRTVLLCSHMLGEVEGLCDRVAILCGGRLAVSGKLSELLERPGVSEVSVENLTPEAMEAMGRAAAENGARIGGVSPARVPLAEYFSEIVRGGAK